MRLLGWAQVDVTDVLIEWGNLDTHPHTEKTPCEHNMAVYKPRREGWDKSFPHSPLRRNQLCQLLNFRLLSPQR